MNSSSLTWQTDAHLAVTALSSALRDLAGVAETPLPIHLSELWGPDGPYEIAVRGHRWALEGTPISLRARRGGRDYRLDLEPLVDRDGRIVGVTGWATALDA